VRRRAKVLIGVAAVVVVLIAARIAAPAVVLRYVNNSLADMGDYRGHVDSVNLYLWRGGYAARNLEIVKAEGKVETPFVSIPRMDLTMQWNALLHGRVVGEMHMFSPVINVVQSESSAEAQVGSGVNWPQEIRELFPFQLNSVRAEDGLITFRAPGIETNDSITMREARFELRNLTNEQLRDKEAFADVDLEGRVMGNAPLKLTGQIDPNEQAPTFNIDLSIEHGRLVDFNPWLRRFLKVDAEAGEFSMYSELASAKNRFEGYVKPILENPKIFDSKEDSEGPFHKAWEALVGLAAKILENKEEKQVATEIPLRGEIESPEAGIIPAIVGLARNAFVAAFSHSLEGSISLRNVVDDVRCLGSDANAGVAEAPPGDKKAEREQRRRERKHEAC
jgi:hypothetical protein